MIIPTQVLPLSSPMLLPKLRDNFFYDDFSTYSSQLSDQWAVIAGVWVPEKVDGTTALHQTDLGSARKIVNTKFKISNNGMVKSLINHVSTVGGSLIGFFTDSTMMYGYVGGFGAGTPNTSNIIRVDNGAQTNIYSGITPTLKNEVKLSRINSNLILEINGKIVAMVSDSTYSPIYAGLWCGLENYYYNIEGERL